MAEEASGQGRVTVRLLGLLHTWQRERGLPSVAELDVPPQGCSGRDVATRLGLPLERIEAVFCNHVAHGLDYVVKPGDAVAFIPQGTPGPHRFTLGIHEAGKGGR